MALQRCPDPALPHANVDAGDRRSHCRGDGAAIRRARRPREVVLHGRAYGLDPVRFDVAALGTRTSDLPSVLMALGLDASIKAWVGFAVAGLLAARAFAGRDFRSTGEMIVGGLVIGVVIVGG
jgi:hypothetical protein